MKKASRLQNCGLWIADLGLYGPIRIRNPQWASATQEVPPGHMARTPEIVVAAVDAVKFLTPASKTPPQPNPTRFPPFAASESASLTESR
jgi:hypothetical protein